VGKEGLAKVIASQINKIIKRSSNDKPVIRLQWKDESITKSIIVNTTHMSNRKTAVDKPSKLESPLTQIQDSQHEIKGSECTRGASNRQHKATISRNSDFFLVNIDTDSLTNSKANLSSKNDSKPLYIEHAKNDEINNQFMIKKLGV
jgi:hypothetical protein